MDLNAISQKFDIGNSINFAAIRLPNSTDIYFVYSNQEPLLDKLKFRKSNQPFFCFSPYGAGNLAFQLVPDAVYKNEDLVFGKESAIKNNGIENSKPELTNIIHTKSDFVAYVEKGVKEIKSGKLKKMVAARCTKIDLKNTFNQATFFSELCNKYPSACVYYFSRNGSTKWIGATPERLLSAGKGGLKTVALAGTQPLHATEAWTDKEKAEQSITADFIRQIFKSNKLKGIQESQVSTIEAGDIQHLCSTFTWKAGIDDLKLKFHKLLDELNPTPAVCGMPKYESSSFISENEKFERRFYSGFIGFDDGLSLDLFVNIRCMEFVDNEGILYAGAGITPHSDPEQEWDETERKMDTLKKLIC